VKRRRSHFKYLLWLKHPDYNVYIESSLYTSSTTLHYSNLYYRFLGLKMNQQEPHSLEP